MALVPLSVSRSMRISAASIRKRLQPDRSSSRSRSWRVVLSERFDGLDPERLDDGLHPPGV
jgi:hypothetical protein